jgi:hypothetical protein
MWFSTELDRVHYRTSNFRLRRRWADEWWYGLDDQRDPAGEKAGLDGCCWRYDGYRERCWAVAWRSVYDECELEVVFLQ